MNGFNQQIIQPKYIYFCHSSIKLSHIVVCTFKFTLKKKSIHSYGFPILLHRTDYYQCCKISHLLHDLKVVKQDLTGP